MELSERLRSLADELEASSPSIDSLVRVQFAVTEAFEMLEPNRPWTPDGHLVGSIGEVYARDHYAIDLDTPSAERHDGWAPDGRLVQVKMTQGKQVGLSSEPEHLLVLRLHRSGEVEEIYNGPGQLVWKAAGKMQKNGQRSVSLSRLAGLQEQVRLDERVRPVSRDVPA